MDLWRNTRNNEEEDRLSALPDELIHHILCSGVELNVVVQTSVLSKRWVNLWTTLSFLNFGVPCFDYTADRKYAAFLTKFLSFRNQETDTCLMSIDFSPFHFRDTTNQVLSIVNYAILHNVVELQIANAGITSYLSFPVLRNLSIHGCHVALMDWNLPCLTNLDLNDVTFVDDELSFKGFSGLKNLSLGGFLNMYCTMEVFRIESRDLETLTVFQGTSICPPKFKFVVSAPKLRCFRFSGRDVPVFSTEGGFPCLEEVDFDINIGSGKEVNIDTHLSLRRYYDCYIKDQNQVKEIMPKLLRLFYVFRETKVLTLCHETIQVLSRVTDFSEYQLSPFVNLKSLNLLVNVPPLPRWENPSIPTSHVITYLLSNSPGAKIFIQMSGAGDTLGSDYDTTGSDYDTSYPEFDSD